MMRRLAVFSAAAIATAGCLGDCAIPRWISVMPLHDGGDVVYMQESDTCPQTLWATSAYRALDHLVMLALDGCKGAKIWIARTGNYHEKKSAEAYRRVFRENSRGGRVLVFAQPLPAIFRYRSEVRL